MLYFLRCFNIRSCLMNREYLIQGALDSHDPIKFINVAVFFFFVLAAGPNFQFSFADLVNVSGSDFLKQNDREIQYNIS